MAQKRVVLVVRGRVQGVFFARRRSVRLADSASRGRVKNPNDGTVEVLAEGERETSIKEFTSWANHGPSAARVDAVDVRWRGYTGEFPEFSILE